MRRLAASLAIGLAACGGPGAPSSSNPVRAAGPAFSTAPVASAGGPLDPAIEQLMQRESASSGTMIIPLAQVDCGARTIAIVWPALGAEGTIVDDDIVGYAYERRSGGPVLVEGRFRARWPGLPECLDAPMSIRRGAAGVARAAIGDALVSRVRAFQRAVAARDRGQFRVAVMRLAELFTDASLFEAFTDALGELADEGIVILAATATAVGISITVRDEDGDVDEATLPLVAVPGRGDVVMIDLDR